MSKLNEALADLNKSIENDKDYVQAYIKRADIYKEKQDYEQANYDYNKVKELEPSNFFLDFLLYNIFILYFYAIFFNQIIQGSTL